MVKNQKRCEVHDHDRGGRIVEGTEEQIIDWLNRNPQYPVHHESDHGDSVRYFVTFVDC